MFCFNMQSQKMIKVGLVQNNNNKKNVEIMSLIEYIFKGFKLSGTLEKL